MLDSQDRLSSEAPLSAGGAYAASPAQPVVAFPYTGDYRIDTLLEGVAGQSGIGALDYRWNAPNALGSPITVTYSFMTVKPYYGGTDTGDGDTGFVQFTTQQKVAARAIMDRLEVELGIQFNEVSDSASKFGEIRFGNNHQLYSAGYSWLPYSTGDALGGDVWISDDRPDHSATVNPISGNDAWATLVHEIGHALGLKHPGDYNAGSGSSSTPGNYLGTLEDNYDYTIMSYNDSPNGHQVRDWYGMYDLLTLKTLYGAGTWGAGDTTYSYTVSAGTNLVIIDDASGYDTLDLSGMTQVGATVDLRPGGFSSIGKNFTVAAIDNLSIDLQAIIEKFIGTPLDDSVTGNDAGNVFVLGAGTNTADGGAGIDKVIYTGARVGYTVSVSGGALHVTSKSAADILLNVERTEFVDSKLAFDLTGNAGTVARIIGALFGAAAVQAHPDYAGIGLGLLDGGMSYGSVMQYALDARLGAAHSHGELVTTLYTNVAGTAPAAADYASFTSQLDSGAQTEVGLAIFAAEHALNAQNIGLVGLAETGLAYA